MPRRFTHARGVELAAKWLRQRCAVVITEMATDCNEEADAIGWRGRRSILVEVKATRADFAADASKSFRRYGNLGMGEQRYYLTPAGLLNPDELPPGWGLLETGPRGGVRETRTASTQQEYRWQAEMGMLLSALRRVGQDAPAGISIRCYTTETQRRATLRVTPEESPDA